jgi:hypothetical protein
MSLSAETQVPLELVQFKLSPDIINQLLANGDAWRAGNRAEWQKIAGKVYNNLKSTNPQWTEADQKLKKEVSPWLRFMPSLKVA